MQPLVVLLTNFDLDVRGGTQLYLRDVALGLLARGHTPVAYSPRLGEVARELAAATVPVTDDLRTLSVAPDLIHAHHNHELFTAALHFPSAPVVRVCHGWLDERPQPFPRVRRYLAVDDTTYDRCVFEWGVPADRLEVLLNFADLERFTPRPPLPPRPLRALVFSHNAKEHIWAVRQACEAFGVAVDTMGRSVGTASAVPERVLGEYDVVFAKGRAAIEALACGAAVVLCDAAGVGSMVTSADLPRLRRLNFGIRTLDRELSVHAIREALDHYDPADAAEVSREIRASAGIDDAIEALVTCYREALAVHRERPPCMAEELQAAALYLRTLSPRVYWTETPAAAGHLLLRAAYRSLGNLGGIRQLLRTRPVRRIVLARRDWRRWLAR